MSDRSHIVALGEGENHEFDAKELSDVRVAQQVGDALCKHYPNHPWIVGIQGGGLVLRHLSIAAEVYRMIGKEGFASLLPRNKLGTADEISKTAVRFGGELLEAFGLRRGAWDGTLPIVPDAWRRGKTGGFQ